MWSFLRQDRGKIHPSAHVKLEVAIRHPNRPVTKSILRVLELREILSLEI